jgi:threonine aldolase
MGAPLLQQITLMDNGVLLRKTESVTFFRVYGDIADKRQWREKVSRIVDLRSDTVTQPTKEMREAMRNAVVGDDYYREDPTVAELEELAAAKLGKEAGLFVASGTMGNLVSILTHTQRGDAVILEAEAHVYRCETAHLAAVAGVMPKRVKGNKGILDPADVEVAMFAEGVLYPKARLLCVENTHNAAGGTCVTPARMSTLKEVADRYGLAIHVDGARIFSAAVALGVDPQELVKEADSATFCLSKNLACPFGSLIVGDREFIERARRNRQMVGGGMRQAGIMAAAGIVALQTMIDRLSEDHANARVLAEGLFELGLEIDMEAVQTNMVFLEVPSEMTEAREFVQDLGDLGVRVNPPAGRRVRMVTHYGITREDVEYTIQAARKAIGGREA